MEFKVGDVVRFKEEDFGYMRIQFHLIPIKVNEFVIHEIDMRRADIGDFDHYIARVHYVNDQGKKSRPTYFKRLELINRPEQENDMKHLFKTIAPFKDMIDSLGVGKLYPVIEVLQFFNKAVWAGPRDIFDDVITEIMVRIASENRFISTNIKCWKEEARKSVSAFNQYNWPIQAFSKIPVKFDKAGRPRCAYTGKCVSYEAMGWPRNMRITPEILAFIEGKKVEPKPVKAEAPKLPDIREVLSKKVNPNGGGVCSYAIQYPDGTIRTQAHDICHARIPHRGMGAIAFASNITAQKNLVPEKFHGIFREWIDWVINKSPVAYIYITKDADEAIEKGMLLDVNVDISRLAVAAVFLRTAHEHRYLYLWKKLIDDGADPFYAWVVCSLLGHSSWADQSNDDHRYVTNYHHGWHHVVDIQNSNLGNLKNFAKNGPKVVSKTPYSSPNAELYSINYSFGNTGKGIEEYARRFLKNKKVFVDDGWGNKVERDGTLDYNSILELALALPTA